MGEVSLNCQRRKAGASSTSGAAIIEPSNPQLSAYVQSSAAAKTTLDNQRADYTETEVAQINLSHRTGELARAASRLGEAGININYGYCGAEPGTNATFVIFGVAEVG